MKIVIFFGILLILRSVDRLLCNGFDQFLNAKVNSSDIIKVKEWIERNRQETKQNICHVYLTYSADKLLIRFTRTLKEFPQINGKLVSHTLIQSQNNTPIQKNTLGHSCSTHDYCEMDFLFHYLDWFINNAYNDDLVKQIFPLLNGEKISLGKFQFTVCVFPIDVLFIF